MDPRDKSVLACMNMDRKVFQKRIRRRHVRREREKKRGRLAEAKVLLCLCAICCLASSFSFLMCARGYWQYTMYVQLLLLSYVYVCFVVCLSPPWCRSIFRSNSQCSKAAVQFGSFSFRFNSPDKNWMFYSNIATSRFGSGDRAG